MSSNESVKPSLAQALVKSVISGDTLILVHPTKRPPVEKTLTLSYISAPRFASKSAQQQQDEPFAFAAREFLRKKCVGQVVNFRVDYSNPQIKRDFGAVFLNTDNENIAISLVKNGFAKVKEARPGFEVPEDHQALLDAQKEAVAGSLGMYATDTKDSTPDIKRDNLKTEKLYNDWKGKTKNAIVEFVKDAGSIRLLVLPTYHVVNANFTGIQPQRIELKPKQGGNNNEVEEVAQPYALEAKFFTEQRLLQKDVQVVFESVDKYGNFSVSIITDPKNQRTFQEDLLSNGFAKIIDWSLAKSKFAPNMRTAESDAKQKRIRVFSDWVEPLHQKNSNSSPSEEFQATVLEVISGDTFVVKDTTTGQEHTISLSSVRSQKYVPQKKDLDQIDTSSSNKNNNNNNNKDNKDNKNKQTQQQKQPQQQKQKKPEDPAKVAFGYEAREFMKKKLIGKNVHVKVDYTRELGNLQQQQQQQGKKKPQKKQGDEEEEESGLRKFCTVTLGNANLGIELINQGFASVIRHKPDEEKSSFYDNLVAAEVVAKDKKLGIHGNLSKAANIIINDISQPKMAKNAKQYLKFFENKSIRTVVERVHSGGRYKLFVPSMNMLINFAISGVACPSFNRHGAESVPDPFAKESQQFAREHFHQRDMEIEVSMVDRVGSFVGNATVNKKNVAVSVLEAGLGRLQPIADRLKNYNELLAAQTSAQNGKKGIWIVEGGAQPVRQKRVVQQTESDESKISAGQPDEFIEVTVTEIISPTHFYVQTADDFEPLQKLNDKIASMNLDSANPHTPKADELVIAKFSDGNWYRAKVNSVDDKEKTASVLFVDFGNSDEVSLKDIRVADAETKKYPRYAKECFMAFIESPQADSEYYEAAMEELANFVSEDRQILAKVEFREGSSRLWVTLHDGETTAGSELVRNGLAYVSPRYSRREYLKGKSFEATIIGLLDDEKEAKDNNLGLYEYGDFYE